MAELTEIMGLAVKLGVSGMVVGFLVWWVYTQDKRQAAREQAREEGLVKRVKEMEGKLELVLVEQVASSREVIQKNTVALTESAKTSAAVAGALADLARSIRTAGYVGERTMSGVEGAANANSG